MEQILHSSRLLTRGKVDKIFHVFKKRTKELYS
jgi:hypothetical protein